MKYTKQAVLLAYKNGVLPRLRKQMIVAEIRKVYDADDEMAILRQANKKPDEYAEYDAYAEQCKQAVDDFIAEVIGR
jgi:hypothetical protein